MKTLKQYLQPSAIFLFAFITISCNEFVAAPVESGINRQWILSNSEKYEKLMKERKDFKSGTYFDILDIKRFGNIFKIEVEGGCEKKAYKVYWDGKIDFSKPLIANLIVTYESDQLIKCNKIEKFTIELDLLSIIGKEYESNMKVMFSNSTKVSDKIIDSDGIITTTN